MPSLILLVFTPVMLLNTATVMAAVSPDTDLRKPGNRVWIQNLLYQQFLSVEIFDEKGRWVVRVAIDPYRTMTQSFYLGENYAKNRGRYLMKLVGTDCRKETFTFIHSTWMNDSKCTSGKYGQLWKASDEARAISYTPTNIYGKPFRRCERSVCWLGDIPNPTLPRCHGFSSAGYQLVPKLATPLKSRFKLIEYSVEVGGNFDVQDLIVSTVYEDLFFEVMNFEHPRKYGYGKARIIKRGIYNSKANQSAIMIKGGGMVFVYDAIGHEDERSVTTIWHFQPPRSIKYELLTGSQQQVARFHLCSWRKGPTQSKGFKAKRPRRLLSEQVRASSKLRGPLEGWKGKATEKTLEMWWDVEPDCRVFSVDRSELFKQLRGKVIGDYKI